MAGERRFGVVLTFVALGASLLAGATVGVAETMDLAPHRAVYHLALDRANAGSGVAAVRGEMAIEWLRGCDGWTFEHKSVMSIEFAAGEAIRLTTNATSWESLDGTAYRFSMRNLTGGTESDRIEGTARLDGPGGAGTAVLAAPKSKTYQLPAGALFPIAHTTEVLRRARAAAPPVLFSSVVFDGMGDEGPLSATATIGKMRRAEIPAASPAAKLAGEAAWPVHVAYYPIESPSPTPKQEIGMRLFANGVADDLTIGFADFVVRATLEKLEFVRPAKCGQ